MSSKTLLTIAGYDPSSGAGVTADLAVFAAHGYFGTSAVTALTVQSTVGVRASEPISASRLRDTLWTLHEDLRPEGVKIGMLATAELVHTVAEYLMWLTCPVVLDPVIRSSSGMALLDEAGVLALTEKLLPLVNWVTPNVAELAALTGEDVHDRESVVAATRKLQTMTTGGIVTTGGHLQPPDDFVSLPAGTGEAWIEGDWVETRATHGTGCAFSSALLCELISGKSAVDAVRGAKEYVRQAMVRAEPRGKGKGPMNLLWPLQQRE